MNMREEDMNKLRLGTSHMSPAHGPTQMHATKRFPFDTHTPLLAQGFGEQLANGGKAADDL